MPGHYGDEEKKKKKKKKVGKGNMKHLMIAGPQIGKMLEGVSSTAKKKDPYSKPPKTKGLLTKAQEVVSTDEVEKRSQLKKRKIKARTEKIDAKTKKIKAKTKKVKAKNALKAARR